MINGIRTIKSYAWEKHYARKIKEIRARQHRKIFAYNVVGSLGYALFQNAGLVVVIAIFVPMWYRGEYISSAEAFSLFAMIFFLFLYVTSLTLYAMSTFTQLFVLFNRLADVFCMEECQRTRDETSRENKGISIEDASFAWGFRVK